MRPYLKKIFHKNKAGGVAQGEGPEFKPQYCKNKKKKNTVVLSYFLPYHVGVSKLLCNRGMMNTQKKGNVESLDLKIKQDK
jgi:hypothetical protein